MTTGHLMRDRPKCAALVPVTAVGVGGSDVQGVAGKNGVPEAGSPFWTAATGAAEWPVYDCFRPARATGTSAPAGAGGDCLRLTQ